MRGLKAAAAGIALVALIASPVSAANNVAIDKLDLSGWPKVQVTVAGGESADFTVTENGDEIADISVHSFEESGTTVEVVLAIDTSGSMQGAPHMAALDAARRFIASVPPNIEVGLVTFADEARVVVRPTTDRARMKRAVDRLTALGETALYDAVSTSVGAFGNANHRNIVLLSDGGDTVSSNSIEGALSAAKKSDVAIYTVGLRSGEFDASALKMLASKTGGKYSASDVSDLRAMFTGLAGTIENQYVVSYRSTSEAGKQFTLAISSADGSDERLLIAPESAAPKTRHAPETPADPLLEGTVGLGIVMALCFMSFALLSYMLMSSSARHKRDAKLALLMTGSADQEIDAGNLDERGPAGWLPDPLVSAAEGVAGRRGWTSSLDYKLERAGSSLKAGELVATSVVYGLAGGIVGALLGSFLLSMVLLVIGALAPHSFMTMRGNRRFSALESQLPDILMVLASSLRAGHSFLQSIDAVANELPDPGGPEFARVVAEIRLGRPLKDAMDDLAERIGSEDFKWAMLAVNIQRNVGGNLAEILDTLAATIRDRDYVRRQISVLSAEGKLSMFVLGALPIAVTGWMMLVNPEYIGLLVTTGLGLFMTTVACALLILGFIWMRKVVTIDV